MQNQPIQYVGEHLWAGHIGNFFIILSFVASLLSALFYFFAHKNPLEQSWLKMARLSFRVHSIGVFGISGTLFFILFNHFYEYAYVFKQVNEALPMRYIFACFWGDQEGSFLLWTMWHVVIGNILIKTAKNYEAPVMFMLAFVQVFLASMLLGICYDWYVLTPDFHKQLVEVKLGSNPFILLRELPEYVEAPFVQSATYTSKLPQFARGLNPLLQNYWMTIHPPTLFLGFALTIVPFSYAIAGVWKKDYAGWQKDALPWTFVGIMVLGTGILMGGAWAYEALSFGGFWAWDPVENASLVPWITLVGAGHVMVINKNKGGSLFTTYFLCIATFILILYSTFLTRSGILGNASVHSFTDLGMQKQLLLFLLVFVCFAILLMLQNKKAFRIYAAFSTLLFLLVFALNIYPSVLLLSWGAGSILFMFYAYTAFFPKDQQEEELWSREFWMFIGSLVLFLCSATIIIFTSIPIFNKLFNTKGAPFTVEKYNNWEVPFAIVIVLLISVSQFFKYRKTDMKQFRRNILISLIISLLFSGVACSALYFFKAYSNAGDQQGNYVIYAILLFCSVFAIAANTEYWVRILKGKIKLAGASIAHTGFALIILGALISTSKKQTLSRNTSRKNVESLGKEYKNQKSILLTKGDTLPMGEYMVTFSGKEKQGQHILFHVEYYKSTENKLIKQFDLFPRILIGKNMQGNTAEPDTRHFLSRDIYTHITYADMNTLKTGQDNNEYSQPQNNVIHLGDTIYATNAIVVLDSLKTDINREDYEKNDSAITVIAVLKIFDIDTKVHKAYPKYVLHNDKVEPVEGSVDELGLKFIFWKINPEEGSVEINLSERKSNVKDFIVMEAYMFPYINILWIGCLVMIIGTMLAVWQRIKFLKTTVND
jgi:cytochrome c-type biogenesis protein CcmF